MLAQNYKGEWLPLAIFFSVLSAVSLVGIVGLGRYRKGIRAEGSAAVLAN